MYCRLSLLVGDSLHRCVELLSDLCFATLRGILLQGEGIYGVCAVGRNGWISIGDPAPRPADGPAVAVGQKQPLIFRNLSKLKTSRIGMLIRP
jgi:hypothetical protein